MYTYIPTLGSLKPSRSRLGLGRQVTLPASPGLTLGSDSFTLLQNVIRKTAIMVMIIRKNCGKGLIIVATLSPKPQKIMEIVIIVNPKPRMIRVKIMILITSRSSNKYVTNNSNSGTSNSTVVPGLGQLMRAQGPKPKALHPKSLNPKC